MRYYDVEVWVNVNEYIQTHKIRCEYLEVVDETDIIVDGVRISFEEDIECVYEFLPHADTVVESYSQVYKRGGL